MQDEKVQSCTQFPAKGFTTKCVRVVKMIMSLGKYYYKSRLYMLVH